MQSQHTQQTNQKQSQAIFEFEMMHRGGASMLFFPNGKPKISSMSTETKKMGLLKKVEELSTLCGVKCCAIIYTSDIDLIPQTWPADRLQMQMFLAKVKSLPEYERTKFSTNADLLIEQSIEKAKLKLARLMRESKLKQAREDMSHFLDGRKLNISLDHNKALSPAIDQTLKDVKRRVKELMNKTEDNCSETNPNKCNNSEAVVIPEQQNHASQYLMKVVEDEMDLSQGLHLQHMDCDLIYPFCTTNESDLITNFNVDNFNFDFEEDQWL